VSLARAECDPAGDDAKQPNNGQDHCEVNRPQPAGRACRQSARLKVPGRSHGLDDGRTTTKQKDRSKYQPRPAWFVISVLSNWTENASGIKDVEKANASRDEAAEDRCPRG
jgi:hypothetical protein